MTRFTIVLLSLLLVVPAQARELKPYQGDPEPPPLRLPDLASVKHDLRNHRGQVVLLNFWATWCPPCRLEMPSMWRLQHKLANKPFTVIAVDMGETKEIVKEFLTQEMRRDFVVLMDKDSVVMKTWRVFALPTSYVIDKQGRIRYALFGALEWDEPEVVEKIEKLVREAFVKH